MFTFENLIIMYSSPIRTCFVQYQTFTVYHILCLGSMFLLFTRVVALSLSLVLWPWDLLFGRVYESLETGKVLLNFIYSSKPSFVGKPIMWLKQQSPFVLTSSCLCSCMFQIQNAYIYNKQYYIILQYIHSSSLT
jgi:hypothetical protein